MNELITINGTGLTVKEYHGQRVVTLKEVDAVHQRPDGTARRTFNANKGHFIDGTDFHKISADEFRTQFQPDYSKQAVEDVTLITESGYLMLVKSFTDDLAWEVQRQLVNTYFRAKSVRSDMNALSPQLQLLISMELKQKEHDRELAAVNQRVDGIREIVALSPKSWREECRRLLAKVAQARGGGGAYQEVNAEVFELVNQRGGVSLETRLTNKRRRMADEGQCKSKRDKLSKVDVIADDKKLIEIYIAVVKDMAVRYGVIDGGRNATHET